MTKMISVHFCPLKWVVQVKSVPFKNFQVLITHPSLKDFIFYSLNKIDPIFHFHNRKILI